MIGFLVYEHSVDKIIARRQPSQPEREWGSVEKALRELMAAEGFSDLKLTVSNTEDGAAFTRRWASGPIVIPGGQIDAANARLFKRFAGGIA
jgi:hypothetical protein